MWVFTDLTVTLYLWFQSLHFASDLSRLLDGHWSRIERGSYLISDLSQFFELLFDSEFLFLSVPLLLISRFLRECIHQVIDFSDTLRCGSSLLSFLFALLVCSTKRGLVFGDIWGFLGRWLRFLFHYLFNFLDPLLKQQEFQINRSSSEKLRYFWMNLHECSDSSDR